ncbi:leader peptidase [Lachnospiraceae bacterium KM106-2]|nr:leader peptidase [Lachnospiraceae bacterium KM106-2]
MRYVVIMIGLIIGAIGVVLYDNKDLWKKHLSIGEFMRDSCLVRKNGMISFCLIIIGGFLLGILSLLYYKHNTYHVVKNLFIYTFLIPVAYTDYKKQIIPNKLVLTGLIAFAVTFLFDLVIYRPGLILEAKTSVFGLLLGGGVFLLCNVLSRNSVGMGDVKLFSVLGLIMGWTGVFNLLFFTILIAAVGGIFLLITRKKNKNALLPLGPFTLLGMTVSLLLGI